MLSFRDAHLLQVHQVPEHFRELFIHTGYRNPRSSFMQCIRSMMQPTNETLNVWTHFLPTLYFLWRLLGLAKFQLDFIGDPQTWPLVVYLICSCLFLGASTVAHVFNTMSDRARHLCFFLDYTALSIYSLGAAVAYHAYSFPADLKNSAIYNIYLKIAVFNACLSMVMACFSRFISHPAYKKYCRIGAFSIPYFFDLIPVIYRLAFSSSPQYSYGGLYYHVRQGIFAFLSAFHYSSHIPERYFPGTFDIVGHSHQLFHIFSTIGAHDQLTGFLGDLEHLQAESSISADTHVPAYGTNVLLVLIVTCLDLVLLKIFYDQLYRIVPPSAPATPTVQCKSSDKGDCNSNTTAHHIPPKEVPNNVNQIDSNGSSIVRSRISSRVS